MKGKYWLILLILAIALAFLVGGAMGTPASLAMPGASDEAAPSETSETRETLFETATSMPPPADIPPATPDPAGMQVYRWASTSPDGQMRVSHWTSTSPDGQWIAEGVVAWPKEMRGGQSEYIGLNIRSADGKRQWTIADEWREIGLGPSYPKPVRWSKDGRSFYYTNRPVVEGCGTFVNGSDLHKVDLDTGMVSELLPPSGFWIALSPDETTVAYILTGRGALVLRDLASGQEREVSIDPGKEYSAGQTVDGRRIIEVYAAGEIVWSPDSKALALTLAFNACGAVQYAESTSILLVDAVSLEVQTLLSEDTRKLVTAEWVEPHQVVLKDPQGNRWIWDVQSKTLHSLSP